MSSLTEVAAGVRLLGGFVESFALHRQLFRLRHEVVELLAALQHLLDGVLQDNFRLVEVFLHLRERISLARVLIPANVSWKLGEIDALFRSVGPLVVRHFGAELVEDLCD